MSVILSPRALSPSRLCPDSVLSLSIVCLSLAAHSLPLSPLPLDRGSLVELRSREDVNASIGGNSCLVGVRLAAANRYIERKAFVKDFYSTT